MATTFEKKALLTGIGNGFPSNENGRDTNNCTCL